MREITIEAFEQDVIQESHKQPVLLDVSAPWCGPCRSLAPHLEALASRFMGRLSVLKINGDNAPAVMTGYGIRTYPTLLLFSAGQVVQTHPGSPGTLAGLLAFVEPIVGAATG